MTIAARGTLFPTPTHLRVLVLAILLVAVDTLPIFLLGAGAITIGDAIGFGPTGLGYLAAAFFLTAGAVSAPIGRLVERIGWQRAMRLNLIGTITVLLAMSIGARNILSMGGLLMAAAFLYGFGNPAANSALAQLVDPGRQGVVFGLKHAGIPTSTLLAGLAVPLIILNIGWRWTFVAGAVLAVGVYLLIPRSLPARSEISIRAERADPLLDARRLRLLALGGTFATVAPSMLGTFTVAAAVDAGIGEAAAGILLSVGGFISIVARVSSGAVVDRYRLLGFGSMAILLALGAVAVYLLASSSGALFIVLLLAAFATAWGW
ncbi:MAG: MFS transporter, partial [Acidimicrobiia bacterium]|nr:MFS transporter [Acidimicrobiia bacterium]